MRLPHLIVLLGLAIAPAPAAAAAPPQAAMSLAQLSGDHACVADDITNDSGEPGCTRVPAVAGARDVAISPDGKFLYVAANDSNAVVSFARAADGALNVIGCTSDDATDGTYGTTGRCKDGDALQSPEAVSVSPGGDAVYAVASGSSSLDTFSTGSDGVLTQLACLRDFVKEGRCGDATALEGANAIAISPDGHNLYVTAGGGNANAVAIFSRAGDGSLTQTGCISSNGSDGACATGAGLVGPADVDVSPDGKFVYVVAGGGRGELPASILTFARDPETGSLSQAGCMFANPPEGPCKDTSPVAPGGALALSPDGRNAYMAGSVGDQSALAVFDRDQSTGKLTQTSCMQEKASPSGDNNGQAAAVQCSEADNLNPSDVIVSRDGKFVYVAESAYSMIAVFARDSASGAVSGDECIQEPNPDIDIAAIPGCQHAIGITDPWSLALSPDGSTLYSAGNGVVAVFATAPASASRAAAVRGGAASIVVSCPGPGGRTCRGNVALVGAHAAKRFSLGAGSMRRIGVRVPGRVQRALRSRRRLPTRVVVRVADGRTRPVVHTVELRLGRPGR